VEQAVLAQADSPGPWRRMRACRGGQAVLQREWGLLGLCVSLAAGTIASTDCRLMMEKERPCASAPSALPSTTSNTRHEK
jgi:hypothetical protein